MVRHDLPRLEKVKLTCHSSFIGWATANSFVAGNRSSMDDIETYLKSDDEDRHRLYLAFNSEQQVVGTVHVEYHGAKAHVGVLTVRADSQSKGIAKNLMNRALTDARDRGCAAAVMEVVDTRAGLIAWYSRLGFYDTGERADMFNELLIEGHVRMIIMEKSL
ncbi:acyl-CoA N-acyltransferase [Hesseltinella vesiculosa]|uniref:Acyl-CoA N-acyltransferase n=1 Tax=Hesseltinella vesiculosa TaxID=101127 RepID=A0A1X2GI38_9FUNG|nr:acyl-CoA N-acyltransferase [Hesseltinella vesiculosa]